MASTTNRATVNLLELDELFGLVICHPTGIWYTTQAGGTTCAHPSEEGFFVPLPFGVENDRLEDIWEVADETVRDFLDENELDTWLEPAASLGMIGGEAWVPVRIKIANARGANPIARMLAPFAGLRAFLTYPNSD